ncbi:MAG: MATE family efflux transporter [Candidatus Ancillula sp.]|jgi:putative MATE family efflux protein|nr:MATE family efflux transporter [Candidatus Ancillula sp.]
MSEAMEAKRLRRQIIKYAASILGNIIVGPMVVFSDTVIVGHILGTDSLAALAVGGTIIQAFLGVFVFMVYVTSAMVARKFGEGDVNGALRFGVNSVYLSVAIGVICALVCGVFAKPLISMMGPSLRVAELSREYIYGMLIFIISQLVVNACTGILRGMKMLKVPVVGSVVCLVVNVPLNLFCLLILKMGLFGSGIASSIATVIQVLVLLVVVLRSVHSHKTSRRASLSGMLDSLKEGIPVLVRTVMLWMSILFLVSLVNKFGAAGTAAMQVVDTVWVPAVFAMDAVAQAINPLVSESMGKRDVRKTRLIVSLSIRIELVLAGLISAFFFSGAFYLPAIFTPDPLVHDFAFWGIFEAGIIVYHASFAFLSDAVMIATKDTKFLAQQSILSGTLFIVSAFFLQNIIPLNPFGFLALYATYDFVLLGTRALTSLWRYRSGMWFEVESAGK